MAIIWPYRLSVSSYVSAGQQVRVPPQRCPSCLRWLVGWGGYWRWLRAPLLVERIWIRRGRCSTCRQSHALLPDLVLVRRLDAVDVIGAGVARKLTSGLGLRPIAEQLDVPHTTLRSWRQRFQARSPTLLAVCTALAVALDGTAVEVNAIGEHAALDVLSVAWQRALARFGVRIGGVWSFWSRISGGQALGTHTTSPWADASGADWMAPSPLGGPSP
jgi:transposase-like protein